MIQKKFSGKVFSRNMVSIVVLFFLVFASSAVKAQDILSSGMNDLGAEATIGTPVDEIISAVREGGLASDQDLSALLQVSDQQDINESISVGESESVPDESAPKIDSLRELEEQGGLSSAPQIVPDTPGVFKLTVKFF